MLKLDELGALFVATITLGLIVQVMAILSTSHCDAPDKNYNTTMIERGVKH